MAPKPEKRSEIQPAKRMTKEEGERRESKYLT